MLTNLLELKFIFKNWIFCYNELSNTWHKKYLIAKPCT